MIFFILITDAMKPVNACTIDEVSETKNPYYEFSRYQIMFIHLTLFNL